MGILLDLLKELPLSAVQKEKILALEKENASLKTEVAILKDQKREIETENERLKDQIQSLTHIEILDESSNKILAHLANSDEPVDLSELESLLRTTRSRVRFRMDQLEEQGYVQAKHYVGGAVSLYVIASKGTAHVVKNGLA